MSRATSARVRVWLRALLAGSALCAQTLAGSAAQAGEREERALELSLLHQPLPLDGVQTYVRARKAWQKLRLPPARVFVVNLWSKACAPCLAELPDFQSLVETTRKKQRGDVEFLFIADPPDETPLEDVIRFWEKPMVDSLAGPRCKDRGTQIPFGARTTCLIRLPAVDPAHSDGTGVARAVPSPLRPVTLLLDENLIIRQAFVGSIRERQEQLVTAIDRMVALTRGRARRGGS